jgi:TatD DNase family protein
LGFLAPVPYRGKTCEPAYVRDIAERVATTLGMDPTELSRRTEEQVEAFFPRMRSGAVNAGR